MINIFIFWMFRVSRTLHIWNKIFWMLADVSYSKLFVQSISMFPEHVYDSSFLILIALSYSFIETVYHQIKFCQATMEWELANWDLEFSVLFVNQWGASISCLLPITGLDTVNSNSLDMERSSFTLSQGYLSQGLL